MERKGRVLLIVPSIVNVSGAGGVAARWNMYSSELSENGWDVELWTIDTGKIPRLHLPFYPDTLTDLPTVGYVLRLFYRLSNTLKPRVDVVITTDLFTNLLTGLCCIGTGVPLVYSLHTDIGQVKCCPMAIATCVQKLIIRMATRSVTTSLSFCSVLRSRGVHGVEMYYRPLPVDEIVNQRSTITAKKFYAARHEMTGGNIDRKILLYIGRWAYEKRLHLLVNARPENCTLCFIGDGPIADVVKSWHDGTNVIVLHGMRPRSSLAVYYMSADYIVSSSAFETFGNVPYEAAHCGTPAILQNAQGFVDQIDPQGHRGALIDFSAPDAQEQLHNAIENSRGAGLHVMKVAQAQAMNGTTISDVLGTVQRHTPIPGMLYLAVITALFLHVTLMFLVPIVHFLGTL